MGFNEIAKYYYSPGWHEPGSTLEFMINKRAFFNLPKHLQTIIQTAAARFNIESLSEFEAKNNEFLQKMIKEGVEVKVFPDEVLAKLKEETKKVLDEMAESDPFTKKVYTSFTKFKSEISQWASYSEKLYHDKL
jgi:TRAP-type mannitol/chloroaromatic compound transport system substrate-binding protein